MRATHPETLQDLLALEGRDVQIAVGAKSNARGSIQPPTSRRNEIVDEGAGCAVVAQHLSGAAAHNVQVSIGCKLQLLR